jgi:hypothetical protein
MQTFLETVGVTGTPATVICLLIAAVSVSALAWAILVTRHEEQPQVVREGEAAAAEWALTRIDAAGDARPGVPRLRTADRSGTRLIARRRSSRGTPPSRCC